MSSSCNKVDEGKPKNEQVTLISSVREIHRVAATNQLRLQHLELAISNLTSICSALRNDLCSLRPLPGQGSSRKVQGQALDNKLGHSRSRSPGLGLKDQMLSVQVQQLVDQAAALGIFNETKIIPTKVSGNVKKYQRATTKTVPKNMQATTQKKMSVKVATVKNMGATQPKGKFSPQIPVRNRATTTAEVSLKSTVKKTRTTISKVYVKQKSNKNKETIISRPNITVRSSVKNVKTTEGKGSIKLKVKADLGDKSKPETKPPVQKKAISVSATAATAKPDIKPRRRWSNTKEVTLK